MPSSDSVRESLSQSANLLGNLHDEVFTKLTDAVFDILLDPAKSEELSSALEDVCSSAGVGMSAGKRAANSLITFVMGCLKKNLGHSHLEKELAAIDLPENKASVILDRYSRHHLQLSAKHLVHSASNSLLDMEWKFGVTASSSELSTVGQTFLQLKMKIGDNTASETVHMELSLPQFYSFLHEMERAKASMDLCS